MALATTGIAGLDAQLGGGVPRGTTLLVIAEPGNAIPLFSEQFAGGGVDAGEDVHYFEFDRPVRDLRKSVMSYVIRGNEEKAQLTLYDGYAASFAQAKSVKLREANAMPIHPAQALATCMGALQSVGGKPYRVVIETLSSLARPDNERELVEFVRNLVFMGQELGGLQLITIVKGLHTPTFEAHLRHLATGVIEFGAERKGFGIYNYLVVSKLLNVKDPTRILLWKETEKGLWLESTKRVF
jgi:archaeal flagellar protein FlaH